MTAAAMSGDEARRVLDPAVRQIYHRFDEGGVKVALDAGHGRRVGERLDWTGHVAL